MHITGGAIEFNEMTSDTLEEDSSIIRERVINARAIQADREQISFDHFAEAVRYRCLDKEGWGTKHTIKKN